RAHARPLPRQGRHVLGVRRGGDEFPVSDLRARRAQDFPSGSAPVDRRRQWNGPGSRYHQFSVSVIERRYNVIERLSRVALLGSAWVLYVLFGLSIFSIGIMIERYIFFRIRKDDTDKLGDDLIAYLREGDLRGAEQMLTKSPSIEAAVVKPVL